MDKDLLITYNRHELLALRQDIQLELFQTDAHNTSERCRKELLHIDAELKTRKYDKVFQRNK